MVRKWRKITNFTGYQPQEKVSREIAAARGVPYNPPEQTPRQIRGKDGAAELKPDGTAAYVIKRADQSYGYFSKTAKPGYELLPTTRFGYLRSKSSQRPLAWSTLTRLDNRLFISLGQAVPMKPFGWACERRRYDAKELITIRDNVNMTLDWIDLSEECPKGKLLSLVDL